MGNKEEQKQTLSDKEAKEKAMQEARRRGDELVARFKQEMDDLVAEAERIVDDTIARLKREQGIGQEKKNDGKKRDDYER